MVGPIVFFSSLALAARDIAELGISWIWWAVIGGGIFFLSGLAIIYGLHKENVKLQGLLNEKSAVYPPKRASSGVFSIQSSRHEFGSPKSFAFADDSRDDIVILRIDLEMTVIPNMLIDSFK